MEFRQLRYFVAVAEVLNFRKAADQLHVAQPALSRQIRQLEDRLGTMLIYRDKRVVELTAAGVIVLDEARAILAQINTLPKLAIRASEGARGQLRLGFISLVAYEFLPTLLRAFRQGSPLVDVSLDEFQVTQQFDALRRRSVDVAILRLLRREPDIETYVIKRPQFVVALPRGHALCQHESLAIRDLSEQEFVSLPMGRGPSFGAITVQICRSGGFEPRAMHDVQDAQAMLGMVSAGVGVAIVPDAVCHLQMHDVVYRRLRDLQTRAEIAVAWRSGDESPLVANFIAVAKRVFPSHETLADAAAASASA